jgi:hypothetical protein
MTEQRPSTTQPERGPDDDRAERPDRPDAEVAAAAREGNPIEGTGANPWPASELADETDPDDAG